MENILNYENFIKSIHQTEEEKAKLASKTVITHIVSSESGDEEEKPKYDYGCVMVYFNFPEITELHEMISKEDLIEDGKSLEDEPHVTLLYGIHSEEVNDEEVMSSVSKEEIKNLRLHNVSAFKNDTREVLKFDVEGEGLHSNNKNLRKLPFTNDFPDYHPHATIAYLKPGTSGKYIEMFKDKTYEVSPYELVYSKPGNDENKIKEKFNENNQQ